MSWRKTQAGMTLIEVMIAISIFAMVGIASYAMLGQTIEIRDSIKAKADRLSELNRAFSIIEKDLLQATLRKVKDDFGEHLPELRADDGGGGLSAYIEFTKSGYLNILGRPRSDLQHIVYRYEDGTFERLVWNMVDRPPDAKPITRPIIRYVKELKIRFMSEKRWHESWPPQSSRFGGAQKPPPALPDALEMTLDTEDWGEIVRLFRVGGGG